MQLWGEKEKEKQEKNQPQLFHSVQLTFNRDWTLSDLRVTDQVSTAFKEKLDNTPSLSGP